MKEDKNKIWWTHVSLWPVEEAMSIITDSAIKYNEKHCEPNWCKLPDAKSRYKDALMRHVIEYISGQEIDLDSNKTHLGHIIANCLILGDLI